MDGADLLEDALEAAGGRNALRALHALHGNGSVRAYGGMTGEIRWHADANGGLREEWDIPNLPWTLRLNRDDAWTRTTRLRQTTAEEAARLRLRARMPPLHPYLDACPAGVPIQTPENAYLLPLRKQDGAVDRLVLDPETLLPRGIERHVRLAEGVRTVTVRLDDYRTVGALLLPFVIDDAMPDQPHLVHVESYGIGDRSVSPYEGPSQDAPYRIWLETVPGRVFSEPQGVLGDQWRRYWGIPMAPRDRWTVNLLVIEQFGRQVEPTELRLDLLSQGGIVEQRVLPSRTLQRVSGYPVARFDARGELFYLRSELAERSDLNIDELRFTLTAHSPGGEELHARHVVPVESRAPHTPLLFPIRGRALVVTGHEPYEWSHTYERSQQFALDIVPLASGAVPGLDTLSFPDHPPKIIAPADGTVVHAKDGQPDDMPPSDYLAQHDALWAIGGNGVVIDHGNGEHSMLFHMANGSVRVQVGERITRGDTIGLVGTSGSPGYWHLHYHLQDGPRFLFGDGLPCRFTNVRLSFPTDPDIEVPRCLSASPLRGTFIYAE